VSGPINRRQALLLGGTGAAALLTGATGWILTTNAGPVTTPGDGSGAAMTGAELVTPQVLDSHGGRLQIELVAARGVRLAGRDTRALGFNATSPGPTLRVRPGDELAVRLTNRLDHPTNLHTHGLRVSPQGNSDNPFLRVDPGASFDYLFRVPTDHPSGTHWYHPHHHGTVADQVSGGLAGALVVDGGPTLPVAADRVLLVGDLTLDATGNLVPASPVDRMQGRQGALVLVNGQHEPVIPARPQGTQRWRIINTCVARVLSLRLEGHPLVQIAHDGTYLPTPSRRDSLVLAPGARADVLVTPTGTGRFALIADPYDRGTMGGMMGGGSRTAGPITLATLVSGGAAAPTPALPAALPAEPSPPPATVQRSITFQMGMGGMGGGGMGMAFTIDGRGFDAARTDQTILAGVTEEWTVRNNGPLAHPFHLHAWPFTVIATSDTTPVSGVPQDVVLVPPGGWARLRIPFTRHTGRSVYHCHILDHEDLGMMATVDVRRP
jgi:FtsP/CotA-like multicopper oxidase with cupredoxin domain